MILFSPQGRSALFIICALFLGRASWADAEADPPNKRTTDIELTPAERERAKGDFTAGREAFSKGDFKSAIEQFQKSYDVTHSPEILYNIGRCYEELKDAEQAIHYYEMYLHFYPAADDARYRIGKLREEQKKAESPPAVEREVASAAAKPPQAKVEEKPKWWNGIRLGLEGGGFGGITGPTTGAVISLSVLAYYPLNNWLLVGINGGYGSFFSKREVTLPSEKQVGFSAGAKGHWPIARVIDFYVRLELALIQLTFQGSHKLIWLAVKGGVGVDYALGDHFRLFGNALSLFGPVLAKDTLPEQLTDPDPETELGFLIGAEYVFL